LAGFTIRNGATRTNGSPLTLQSGGGVWSPTFYGGASVANCLFTNNASGYRGGGMYGGAVKNSIFVGKLWWGWRDFHPVAVEVEAPLMLI
jgi:hypothetical protein